MRGSGSVLPWRYYNTLCISGCADDVTFSHNGAFRWQWRRRRCAAEKSQKIRIRQVPPRSLTVMVYIGSKLCTGGVVCRLRLLASSLADKHCSQSLHYSAKNKLSPRGRRDDMPPPMAVRLAADLRPSADGSAVRTMAKLQRTNVPTT